MKKLSKMLNSDKIGIIEIIFKILYGTHLLLSANVLTIEKSFLNITLVSVVLLGGFLLFCRVMNIKLYLKTPALPLLIAFVASFVISSFAKGSFDTISTIKTTVWMTFQFGILFAFSTEKSESYIKKELLAVGGSLLAVVTIENIISLYLLFTKFFEVREVSPGRFFALGVAPWGRLYGVHTDPNYSCLYAIAVMLFALYVIIKFKNIFLKITMGATVLINFSFVVFSASRSGLLCSLTGFGCFAALTAFAKYGKKAIIRAVSFSVITCIFVLLLQKGLVAGFNYVATYEQRQQIKQQQQLQEQQQQTVPPSQTDPEAPVPENPQPTPEIPEEIPEVENIIGRTEEEIGEDISNRRFDIWKSGFDIFKKNPIMGIGFENILGYVETNMPDSYLINNDLGKFDAMHNAVIDVLVSQGIIGIIIALAFAVMYIMNIIKRTKTLSEKFRYEAVLCISVLIVYLVSIAFLSHIFYINITTTFIFWLFAGYTAYFFNYNQKENN